MAVRSHNVQSHAPAIPPLDESTFFILLSLACGPKDGYAIVKEVERLSKGWILLSTGTLYGALKRLLERSWIERREDPVHVTMPGQDTPDGPRHIYRLTEQGWRILGLETTRLRRQLRVACPVLGDEPA